jgi:hypothetical protein
MDHRLNRICSIYSVHNMFCYKRMEIAMASHLQELSDLAPNLGF